MYEDRTLQDNCMKTGPSGQMHEDGLQDDIVTETLKTGSWHDVFQV